MTSFCICTHWDHWFYGRRYGRWCYKCTSFTEQSLFNFTNTAIASTSLRQHLSATAVVKNFQYHTTIDKFAKRTSRSIIVERKRQFSCSWKRFNSKTPEKEHYTVPVPCQQHRNHCTWQYIIIQQRQRSIFNNFLNRLKINAEIMKILCRTIDFTSSVDCTHQR